VQLFLELTGFGGVISTTGGEVTSFLLVATVGNSQLLLKVINLIALISQLTLNILAAFDKGRGRRRFSSGLLSLSNLHHAFHGGLAHLELVADLLMDLF